MPIKKDASGKRWVEMDILVPGTPEQVWDAMATGPGNTGWFVEAKVEPRVGGELSFDFGEGATAKGEVTAWSPPHQFGYVERDWSPGAPPVATEITITSRTGNTCLVRMVHSLFTTSDEWDDQVEGFESGWPGFFALLRLYLAHFAGKPAASFMIMKPANTDALSAWQRLGEDLGLVNANVGEQRTTSPSAAATAPDSWTGVVEYVLQDAKQRYVILRLEGPTPGIVLVGTHISGSTSHAAASKQNASVSVCRYFYGDDAEAQAAASEPRWRAWLASAFGATPS